MPRFRNPEHTCRVSDAPRVIDRKNRERTVDPGALAALEKAKKDAVITSFDRFVAQQPQCRFGYEGICCKLCLQGPCRVKAGSGPASEGICGATVYTIVLRNLVRLIAGGASAHSDHGKHMAQVLGYVGNGMVEDYGVADVDKLRAVAGRIGIQNAAEMEPLGLAAEVARSAMEDYARLDEHQSSSWVASTVTPGRVEKFESHAVMPSGINANIVELISGTHVGMDADPVNLVFHGLKTALCDYAGMHIATDVSDILFGVPQPVVSEANFGVLDENKVNLAVNGHNPLLSEIVVAAAREMEDEAIDAGAAGINIVGICCTGNEILMRKGIPLAASFASQELAITTGVVDAMVVDIQCIMPSLAQVAECYHTKVITTSPRAKIPGAYHIPFDEGRAMQTAMEIIRIAIKSYRERNKAQVFVPDVKNKVISGFSLESLLDIFAAVEPEAPMRAVTNAILAGELKGVALFAGCNNLKGFQDHNHLTMVKEMARNDVLVLTTGCSAQALAKSGLLNPEAVDEYAGNGLKKFLNRLNDAADLKEKLPLAFHMGSCVDNTRPSNFVTLMADTLGVDVPKVPFVASAPEAMSEKAVSIGSWLVAMGLPTHVGTLPPIEGSKLAYGLVTQIGADVFGGHFMFETDPEIASRKLLSALEYRRWKLQVHKQTAEKFQTQLCQGY